MKSLWEIKCLHMLSLTKHETDKMFVCFQVQHLQTDPDLGPRLLFLQVGEVNTHTHTLAILCFLDYCGLKWIKT